MLKFTRMAIHHRTPLSVEVRKSLKLLMSTLLGMLVIISAYFFVKMSSTAEQGSAFTETQFKQKTLESENRILKQRVLDAQSIEAIEGSTTTNTMHKPGSPIYLSPPRPISSRD